MVRLMFNQAAEAGAAPVVYIHTNKHLHWMIDRYLQSTIEWDLIDTKTEVGRIFKLFPVLTFD